LPYMEQTPLFQALIKALPSTDPRNALAMRSPVSTFFCPSRREPAADRNFDNNDQPPPEENRGVAAGGDYAGSAGLDIGYGLANPNGEPPGEKGGALYTFSRNSIRNVTDGTSQTIGVGEKYIPTEDEVRQAHPNVDEGMMHYRQGDTAYFAGDNRFAILRGTECGMAHGEAPTPLPAGTACGVADLWAQFGSEHPGLSNFVFLDGHVQAIQQAVDVLALQLISSIADDQVVDVKALE
jgi:prepilin-type processing-associated H-X9-DG protein